LKERKSRSGSPLTRPLTPVCHMTLCPKMCSTHARFAVKPASTQPVHHAYLGSGRPLVAQRLGRGGRPPPPPQCRMAPARHSSGAAGARAAAAAAGATQRPAAAARPGQAVSRELLQPAEPSHRPPRPRPHGPTAGGLKALSPPPPHQTPPARLRWPGSGSHLTPRSAQERHGQTAAAASWGNSHDKKGSTPGPRELAAFEAGTPAQGARTAVWANLDPPSGSGSLLQTGPVWSPLQSANHIRSWCRHLIFSHF